MKAGLESRLPGPAPAPALPKPSARAANGSRTNGEAKAAQPRTPVETENENGNANGNANGGPQSYQEMCLWLCQRAELMDGEQEERWRKVLQSILGARRGK